MVARLAFVLAMIPLCSYASMERLQGVALTSSLPSTTGAAVFAATSSAVRCGRPAVLLSCWTLLAKPVDLLAASPPHHLMQSCLVTTVDRCMLFIC